MLTTIGKFFATLPPHTFMVVERDEEGPVVYPIEDILHGVPAEDSSWECEVIVYWNETHDTALMAPIVPDAHCRLFKRKDVIFVPNCPPYLYPIGHTERIIEHAKEQARLDDAWMYGCYHNRAEVEMWAREYIGYEQEIHHYLTDDLAIYTRIYVEAYTDAYITLANKRQERNRPPRLDGMMPLEGYPREEWLDDDGDFGCAVSC